MTKRPPRTVISKPKNARSERTRAALLAAARTLLEQGGFDCLTMTALGERAGVTRRAVYLHFRSRAEVVNALYDYLAETEHYADSLQAVWSAPTAVDAVAAWARHFAFYASRVLEVDRAVQRVWRADPHAARLREKVLAVKRKGCRRLFEWLDREGSLAPPWTVSSATEMLVAMANTEFLEFLTVEKRWPQQRFAAHFARVLNGTFVAHPGCAPTIQVPTTVTRQNRPPAPAS